MYRRRNILPRIFVSSRAPALRDGMGTHLHLRPRTPIAEYSQFPALGPDKPRLTVSYIPKPAVTLPPGELMYSLIGFSASSASRKRSWAVRSVDIWSATWTIQRIWVNICAFRSGCLTYGAEEYHAFAQETRVDVIAPFTSALRNTFT